MVVIKSDRTKFNVGKDTAKRTYNDVVFDSVLEMKYYRDVILPRVGSGEIVKYELQKPYILQPEFRRDNKKVQAITYVADFYLEFKDGTSKVVDVKGMPDAVAKLKRKMFWYTHPEVDYRWVSFSAIDSGWCDYEYIIKCRRERKKLKKAKEESV